jgi:hypothetical protein
MSGSCAVASEGATNLFTKAIAKGKIFKNKRVQRSCLPSTVGSDN